MVLYLVTRLFVDDTVVLPERKGATEGDGGVSGCL